MQTLVVGRPDQDMGAVTDAYDRSVLLPLLPVPTEIFMRTNIPGQPLWYSFTGLINDWSRTDPCGGIHVYVPTGATTIYLRKPRNKTPDVFNNTSDDLSLLVTLEFLERAR